MKRLIPVGISALAIVALASPSVGLSDAHEEEFYEGLGNKIEERFEDELYDGLGNKIEERFEDELYDGLGNKGKESDPEYVGTQFEG